MKNRTKGNRQDMTHISDSNLERQELTPIFDSSSSLAQY